MNELVVKNFPHPSGTTIRVIYVHKKPWICVRDVMCALGHARTYSPHRAPWLDCKEMIQIRINRSICDFITPDSLGKTLGIPGRNRNRRTIMLEWMKANLFPKLNAPGAMKLNAAVVTAAPQPDVSKQLSLPLADTTGVSPDCLALARAIEAVIKGGGK